MSFRDKVREWFGRDEAVRHALHMEAQSLQDEQRDLLNEARFQSEPAFAEYRKRLRDELKIATNELYVEIREPQRSIQQGRCQMLLQQIERPEYVQARLGVINQRLEELRAEAFGRDDGDTVVGVTGHNG